MNTTDEYKFIPAYLNKNNFDKVASALSDGMNIQIKYLLLVLLYNAKLHVVIKM